ERLCPNLLSHVSYKIESLPFYKLKLLGIDPDTVCAAHENGVIYLKDNTPIREIVHEIGHAVHQQLFQYKVFELSEELKSEYAYKNYREDFAEAFADLFERGRIETIRDQQIYSILNSLE
ncbi:hypothetical protein, partial [Brevibacillus brevis]|uniref:hypothetical protein n=1 Tax=Brevibacillus brevis TaxID=1393 RepID=UPI001C12BE91